MKTTQAWGWLAVGVLALGLNGFYHDGGAEWAHAVVRCVASRSAGVLAVASGRAEQFLQEAQLVAAREETHSCRLGTNMARLQSRMARGQAGFARVEALSARQEAALARLEANRARIEAQVERAQLLPAMTAMKLQVICPRTRVSIPRTSIPRVEIPQIEIPQIDVSAPAEVHVGAPI